MIIHVVSVSIFRDYIDSRVEEHIDQLRVLLRNGACMSQIKSQLEKALEPGSFFEAIGGVAVYAPRAIGLTLDKHVGREVNTEYRKTIWELFTTEQRRCDSFFGNGAVREWIIAAALKRGFDLKWDEVGEIMHREDWLEHHRSTDWWRVAWSFKVNEIVETVSGPGRCTKELFVKTWKNFDPKDILHYLESMPPSVASHFRCIDLS